MGSGQKSNGTRPVNKVDGSKKRARKAMHKSRRADAKKATAIDMGEGIEFERVMPFYDEADFVGIDWAERQKK